MSGESPTESRYRSEDMTEEYFHEPYPPNIPPSGYYSGNSSYNVENEFMYGGFYTGLPPDWPQTPGLVPEAGSSQTRTSFPLPTPPNRSFYPNNDYLFSHPDDGTDISRAMENFNLGESSGQLAYHNIAGPFTSQEKIKHEEDPPPLFHSQSYYRLDDIHPDLSSLQHFPEAGVGGVVFESGQPFGWSFFDQAQHDRKDPLLSAPSGDSLDVIYHASPIWPGRPNTTTFPPTQPLSGPPGLINPSEYVIQNQPSERVSSPISFQGPLSPSGIGHAISGWHGENFPVSRLPVVDDCIVKKEGASPAHRDAVNKRRHKPWRYNCHICSDRFTSKQNLGNHINSHKQVRPYKCSYCPSKYYRHLRSLHRHLTKEHQWASKKKSGRLFFDHDSSPCRASVH